jgi:restriction endonuclease S subunit
MVVLGKVCDVRDGTHDSPQYCQSGFPLITSKNIVDGKIDFNNVNYISKIDLDKINKRSKVDYGDIIMPMIGTIGNPIVAKENYEFAIKNVALIKFYKNSKINNYFLKFILESDYFNKQYINFSNGSTQKFISLKFIRNLKVPLPPKDTQDNIVCKLENEQKIIDANKELIKIYKQKIKDKIAEGWSE